VNKVAISLLRPLDHQRHITPNATEELKVDGFRALAFLENGCGELVTRNGNTFKGFAELAREIAKHLPVKSAVLDGELAASMETGDPSSPICFFVAAPLERVSSPRGKSTLPTFVVSFAFPSGRFAPGGLARS
jgi:hypothetical protein